MAKRIERGIGKRALLLCALIINILLFFQNRDFGFIRYLIFFLSCLFLFFLIYLWVSLLFHATSPSEKAKLVLAILQYAFFGKPKPLAIVNGSISNEYFLAQKKPDHSILLIRNQSAAIVQDDREKKYLLRQGVHFLPKKWEIIYTLDTSIKKIEFGPYLNEDPFTHILQEESLILQQARKDREALSKFQTKDNETIFVSGTILYQIDLSEGQSENCYFLNPTFHNQFDRTEYQELSPGCITDDLNKKLCSLVMFIMQTAIRQFNFEEIFLSNPGQSNQIDAVIKDINLIMKNNGTIDKGSFSYLSQDQINSVIERFKFLCFVDLSLVLTKIWFHPDSRR